MRTLLPVALALLFSACNPVADIEHTLDFAKRTAEKAFAKNSAPTAQSAASPSPTPLNHREVNAEFVKELYTVVLQRDLRSEEEFLRMVNTLDQGGHYEGAYNGLVYSSEYRAREKGNVTVKGLKLFADVMAQLTLDQKYDPLIIPKPTPADVPPAASTTEERTTQPPQPTEEERKKLVAEIEAANLTQPSYSLKRRLGEEALKTIDLKKEYREKLATWYGKFTAFLNKRGQSIGKGFGIKERDIQDEYYHYKWALDADEDRIKWETLHRIHVLMNGE